MIQENNWQQFTDRIMAEIYKCDTVEKIDAVLDNHGEQLSIMSRRAPAQFHVFTNHINLAKEVLS